MIARAGRVVLVLLVAGQLHAAGFRWWLSYPLAYLLVRGAVRLLADYGRMRRQARETGDRLRREARGW